MPEAYPDRPAERDRWILARRGTRNALDPRRPYAFLVEDELAEDGAVVPVATVFLTNRECPWRCLMCDLWQNTLTERLPPGAIPEQIDHALAQLPSARQIKLYNSGSFFDSQAIPVEDYEAIARRVATFERVVVESHPALVGPRCAHLRDLLHPIRLEVAMGLETVHPEAGPRLNKRMTLDQFARASAVSIPSFRSTTLPIQWMTRPCITSSTAAGSGCCASTTASRAPEPRSPPLSPAS